MRILADLNVAPRTVAFLRSRGHDVVRVDGRAADAAADAAIVEAARRDRRAVLTQDLDFSAIVALSGRAEPSVISVRLTSSRVEAVNARLDVVLPLVEQDVAAGAIVTVEDVRVRCRLLPI